MTSFRAVEEQLAIIAGQAEQIVPEEELAGKLAASRRDGRPLRVKYGIDPTNPHIHIGHLVPCRLLRTFQDLGHTAVLIVGDYTARIGDPTGRNAERPSLSEDEVRANAALYADQLFTVIRRDAAEIHFQSSWFASFGTDDLLRLLAGFSVAGMLSHETFRRRLESGNRLSLHELTYPALQAYDSVVVRADVEVGGSDQLFNCLCGRDLQRARGESPQVVVTVPLLKGTDGAKMSKSLDNHIPLSLPPEDVVGRIMSISDALLPDYIRYATDWSSEERKAYAARLSGEPREVKLAVARRVAAGLHGEEAAAAAVQHFERVFSRRQPPADMPELVLDGAAARIVDILVLSGLAATNSEARRLVAQGGVRIDGLVVTDFEHQPIPSPDSPAVLQVGRRRFLRLIGRRELPSHAPRSYNS